jgi:hypothetical protein
LLFAVLLSLCLTGCRVVADNPPVEKEGRTYGISDGNFRSRWWNYYERGRSFMDGEFWQKAEYDFRQALLQSDTDQRRVRTYGRHITDYFPHRELGICLFRQNRLSEAIAELEISLSSEKTARAEFYLDRARKSRIEKEGLDRLPPEIRMENPADAAPTSSLFLTVQGSVKDDTFVSRIRIKGKEVRIDLSAPEIRFAEEVPLKAGENIILIQSEDLSGKISELQSTVFCDRIGPVLSLDSVKPDPLRKEKYRLTGYTHDISGIRSVRVNGQLLPDISGNEIRLDHFLTGYFPDKPLTVTAEDMAGNQTKAEIAFSETSAENEGNKSVLLASRESFPLFASQRGIMTPEKRKSQQQKGKYHALFIGIDAYEQWPVLKNAVRDAAELQKILCRDYGFSPEDTLLLRNGEAGWDNLMNQMKNMAAGLGENDSFLLYFAGHGQLDSLTGDGYWIPSDGTRSDPSSWITNSAIREVFTTAQARHVLIIADACYSGSLLRSVSFSPSSNPDDVNKKLPPPAGEGRGGGEQHTVISNPFHPPPAPPSREGSFNEIPKKPHDLHPFQQRIMELYLKKSRQVIASGGMEPVSDVGKEGHSLFAHYFLRALAENPLPVTDIEYLFHTRVWKHVVEKGGQRPVMGRMICKADEDGQFVLRRSSAGLPDFPPDSPALAAATERTAVSPEAEDRDGPEISVKGWDTERSVYNAQVFLEIGLRDRSGIQRITVNSFPLLTRPGRNLHCNYIAELKEGENMLELEGTDQLGNKSRKRIRILRQIPKIYQSSSRMSLALGGFSLKGETDYGAESLFRNRLLQSERFDIRIPADQENATQKAKETGAEFLLRGEIISRPDSFQMLAELVSLSDSLLLTAQDVYGENTDEEGIRNLSRGLVLKLCEELPRLEGQIIEIRDDKILINRGREQRMKKGMPLIFFEEGQPLVNPATGEELGADTIELGSGRVWDFHPRIPGVSLATLPDGNRPEKLKIGGHFVSK